jgi:hypothetical protein
MKWDFFGSPLLIFIPPLLHTHLSPSHEVYDSPDQAAPYHTVDHKLRASSLDPALDWSESKGSLVLV